MSIKSLIKLLIIALFFISVIIVISISINININIINNNIIF